MNSIWIEKYRPKSLNEIYGNEPAINKLKQMVISKNIFHLLLCGPPGVGKTAAIISIAKEHLGSNYSKAIIELNAADERGIDVVRQKIKTFAQEKVNLPPNTFKIIMLDEVEAMTESAQQSLRRIFEQYAETTRFFLTCNTSDKVIEPIQSRCVLIRMNKLSEKEMTKVLTNICKSDNIKYADEAIQVIVRSANGDCRKAIGLLQTVHSCSYEIDTSVVYNICHVPPSETIKSIYDEVLKQNFINAHNICEKLLNNGYQEIDIIQNLRSYIDNSDIPEAIIVDFHKVIANGLTNSTRNISQLQLEILCELSAICNAVN